jgi:hypothetical protein
LAIRRCCRAELSFRISLHPIVRCCDDSQDYDEKKLEIDDVARDLGMTTNACFIARSRILKRLRELLRGLFGDDEGLLELMG